MMKTVLALTIVGAVYAQTASQSSFAAAVGTALGDANLGSCLAFQDDQTDTTTTCYISCSTTASKIGTAFDSAQYEGGVYNSGQMMTYLQNAGIQLMSQFKDCRTTEFLFSLDNRLSDQAFLSGTAANLATQIGTLIAYSQLIGQSNVFLNLFYQHAMYKLYDNLHSAVFDANSNLNPNYKSLGKILTNYMLSVVSYKAPNVNTGLKSK